MRIAPHAALTRRDLSPDFEVSFASDSEVLHDAARGTEGDKVYNWTEVESFSRTFLQAHRRAKAITPK